MTWEDRLKEAAYNSPSGQRMTFDFEDVSRSFDKRGTAFNPPGVDGTYVQQSGRTGGRYPLRVFFWGGDCDLAAVAFEDLLAEDGEGRLEHPIYGEHRVVPFGAITRRDDLKTAANQAVIEVTFWETTGIVYPTSQDDPASLVLSAVERYNRAVAEQLEDDLGLDTALERVSFRNTYTRLLDDAEAALKPIADTQDNVQRQFGEIVASIDAGIDTLIADPLSLAFQTVLLTQAPSRASADISDRLSAYRDLATAITTGDGALVTAGSDSRQSNRFHGRDLFASTYVTGSVLSAVNNQFETKTDALQAAAEIIKQFDTVVAWRDANYASLEQVDTGAAYQQLQEAVALAAGFLVFISFSLKQERRVVLDRARTVLDLAAELYGSTDNRLDFLIASNTLSGSEILELPEGREIVYYI